MNTVKKLLVVVSVICCSAYASDKTPGAGKSAELDADKVTAEQLQLLITKLDALKTRPEHADLLQQLKGVVQSHQDNMNPHSSGCGVRDMHAKRS